MGHNSSNREPAAVAERLPSLDGMLSLRLAAPHIEYISNEPGGGGGGGGPPEKPGQGRSVQLTDKVKPLDVIPGGGGGGGGPPPNPVHRCVNINGD